MTSVKKGIGHSSDFIVYKHTWRTVMEIDHREPINNRDL